MANVQSVVALAEAVKSGQLPGYLEMLTTMAEHVGIPEGTSVEEMLLQSRPEAVGLLFTDFVRIGEDEHPTVTIGDHPGDAEARMFILATPGGGCMVAGQLKDNPEIREVMTRGIDPALRDALAVICSYAVGS